MKLAQLSTPNKMTVPQYRKYRAKQLRDTIIACPFEGETEVNIAHRGDALEGGICEFAGDCGVKRCGYNRTAVVVEMPVESEKKEVA